MKRNKNIYYNNNRKIRCMVKRLQAFDMEKHCEIQCIHNLLLL